MGGTTENVEQDSALGVDDLDDLRITNIRPLMPSACLIDEVYDPSVYDAITGARIALSRVVKGSDDRLIVVTGPSSTHDPDAALEYARQLKPLADKYSGDLIVVMRVFLDRPAGGAGSWSGAMFDPDLDGSYQINKGFRRARQLLLEISKLGLPTGCLYLDAISPQFIADLVSWSSIGERTAESKLHRELASGLSTPVGFQATKGSVSLAIDAVRASAAPHAFLSVSKQGVAGIVETTGNCDCLVVLPAIGGAEEAAACAALSELQLPARVMVDCGAGGAQVSADEQAAAAREVASRIAQGSEHVCGVLLASFLIKGQQSLAAGGASLIRGQSVTSACIDWSTTTALLETLSAAVQKRRRAKLSASAPVVSRGDVSAAGCEHAL